MSWAFATPTPRVAEFGLTTTGNESGETASTTTDSSTGFDTITVRGVGSPASSSAANTPALFREVTTASRSLTHGTDSRVSTTDPSMSRDG